MKFLFFLVLLGVLWWVLKRGSAPPQMARTEAAKLLGVRGDAGPAEVSEAHRRLIAKVHPDAGGSAELAARINQARDAMLR